MITEESLKQFFASQGRLVAARMRTPPPRFTRYVHHNTWHVCLFDQRLVFDDSAWIEVVWSN